MIIYFDTSALVKLIVTEDASALVQRLWLMAPEPYASQIGYTELRAAVARAVHAGRAPAIGELDARLMVEGVWQRTVAVGVNVPVVRRAGALAERHFLRALDAIHLASALSVASPGDHFTFVTFDRRLAEAALAEGLAVLPEVA